MTLFSLRSEYALRALTEIARWRAAGHAEPLAIEEIARRQDIPRKFLEQILVTLKRAGLVQSRRGQAGGYLIELDPESIRLRDVLGAIESLPAGAAERGAEPPTPIARAVRKSFQEIEDVFYGALSDRTLADLMELSRTERSQPMYHI